VDLKRDVQTLLSARWNAADSAIEMPLVSLCDQIVEVDGRAFAFRLGEPIQTENSRKSDVVSCSDITEARRWRVNAIWSDPHRRFAVFDLDASL
jgi:uncharacterized SAM-dependent methyltransferase